MSTKFFNNTNGNTLFEKLRGIAENMSNFALFCAAVGYFRASGYFKLRELLENVPEIRVLVGINIDKLFRKHQNDLGKQRQLFTTEDQDAREQYIKEFCEEVSRSGYTREIEEGILRLGEDLRTGKLKMKVHPRKDLHAKFYLCLPENFSENSDGWVIMGSSNLSAQGLGMTEPPRYELNVAMKDFDDVNFCRGEFESLWNEAVDVRPEDYDEGIKGTHLIAVTPYEVYMKLLIEYFGEQVEDNFILSMPDGYYNLKYQYDAVIQGYQMMKKYNGFILADVVGLGKTIVTAMVARRFLEYNGRYTSILVVSPPAVKHNWISTFNDFGLNPYTHYITSGSLEDITLHKKNYKRKDEYDLIIIDEAHNYRHDDSQRFDRLQTICKSRCTSHTRNKNQKKKIILISATPLNNRPDDLKNLISLFQDTKRSTLDGIINLDAYFANINKQYKTIKSTHPESISESVKRLYDDVRNDVLQQITIRRTRHNLLNSTDYMRDLEKNGIKFPSIEQPVEWKYRLSSELAGLFIETVDVLTEKLDYTRYRAIEHLTPMFSDQSHENAKRSSKNLAGIYKVNMVKRLESSFYAFKRSLNTFITITEAMIEMYDKDQVVILGSRDNTLRQLQHDGLEFDEILDKLEKSNKLKDRQLYPKAAFKPEFIEKLNKDRDYLRDLQKKWAKIEEDPKLDLFIEKLRTTLFNANINTSNKLVVFSESVDTVTYLANELTERLPEYKVLAATSQNRDKITDIIRSNFDANTKDKKDEYQILVSSDVLSEGINLHRSHLIVNYDSPWNATRLMQRIGRVNRIGSVSEKIHNYLFYPSDEGDSIINLTTNAKIKIQGFHSALGEDAQIFSRDEIVEQFELFNKNIKDDVDEQLAALREVRKLFQEDRTTYERIKALPPKIRVARKPKNEHSKATTVVYLSSAFKSQFYLISDKATPIHIEQAIRIFKAKKDERAEDFLKISDRHFKQVNQALTTFTNAKKEADPGSANATLHDPQTKQALKTLRDWARDIPELKPYIDSLKHSLEDGVLAQLPPKIKTIKQKASKESNTQKTKAYIEEEVKKLAQNNPLPCDSPLEDTADIEPTIILSESFI